MTDRTAQARAEAERQIRVYGDDFKARTLRANLNDAFVQGVAWADANPQPHTITRDERDRMVVQISHDMPDEPMWSCVVVARNALKALGIEVEGTDEA